MLSRLNRRLIALFSLFAFGLALPILAIAIRSDAAADVSSQGSGVALDWYDITNQTVNAAAFAEPVQQSRTWAVSWLAASRTVGDSHHGGHSQRRSFSTAAFATALHDTLVALVPAQQSALDTDLASTLAGVPNGNGKQRGIAAGQHEAAQALAERNGDGLDTASVDAPFTPPPAAPGVWQPTPPTFGPAIRAGQGKAHSFLLRSNDQSRPPPPPALDSKKYLDALAEVRSVGQDTSSTRTAQQTDVALFWEPASNPEYVQVLRGVLSQNAERPLAWQARFVAAFHVITTDAQIAIFEAKYKYVSWRPVTAIRTGSVDQNPSWTPFFATPRHPEYPSGHGGYAGAAQEVLTAFVGPGPADPVSATSATDPGVTHTWNRWSQITQENIDGRVWEGIHFRFSDLTGVRVGKEVADYDLHRLGRLGL